MDEREGYNPPVERGYFCSGSDFRPHSEATYWLDFPLHFTVYLGRLDTLENMSGRFDLIRMNNVIEHVQHSVRFLEKAHHLLKASGRIYCSTPNGFQDGRFLQTANKHGFRFNLLENYFFYYHPRTLQKMFEACGFKIIRLKSWRLRFNKIRREFLTLRFPVSLPLGHQQLVYAEKA
jgi:2-polyprenyl-3-methyl-5-hydroxy-6-metoxy-1,4-benzoquinol methylase